MIIIGEKINGAIPSIRQAIAERDEALIIQRTLAQAKAAGTKVISCMGTGTKMDATGFLVADISKTSGCALARIMRKECAKRGIKGVKVVYSKELPLTPTQDPDDPLEPQREGSSRRSTPGSNAFVPGVAGLIMAGEVIKDLSK